MTTLAVGARIDMAAGGVRNDRGIDGNAIVVEPVFAGAIGALHYHPALPAEGLACSPTFGVPSGGGNVAGEAADGAAPTTAVIIADD